MEDNYTALFVCGCPRSGTTAFARYLTFHPSNYFAIFIERYGSYWKNNFKFPDKAFVPNRISNVQEGETFYDSIDVFPENIRALQNLASAKFVGDKIPLLWKNLKALFEQFPNAKVFYLWRDIYSVAESYKRRALNPEDKYWGHHRDVLFAINEWNESIKAIVEAYNEIPDFFERIFIVEHYKFVTNSFCKNELNLFLNTSLDFPDNFFETKEKSSLLNPVEKQMILELIDTSILEEFKKLLSMQRIHYYRLTAPKRYHPYETDKKLIGANYGEFIVKNCPYIFRGRRSPLKEKYVSVLGSATTYGRFIKRTYVDQLDDFAEKKKINVSFVNLGLGGARPSAYLSNADLLDFILNSELVIIELMSARGYTSPLWESNKSIGNLGIAKFPFRPPENLKHPQKFNWLISKIQNKESVFFDRQEILLENIDKSYLSLIFDVTIKQYIDDLSSLIDLIKKPIIFIFVTRRNQKYINKMKFSSWEEWTGNYPHFIDHRILEYLKYRGFSVVEVNSSKGIPYVVKHWESNEPVPVFNWQEDPSLNTYYPSQEIHDEIFNKLIEHPLISELLNKQD